MLSENRLLQAFRRQMTPWQSPKAAWLIGDLFNVNDEDVDR
jgi:hypothetical protein